MVPYYTQHIKGGPSALGETDLRILSRSFRGVGLGLNVGASRVANALNDDHNASLSRRRLA